MPVCLQSADPLQTTETVGRWVAEQAGGSMINQYTYCPELYSLHCNTRRAAHRKKFADRGALGRSTVDAASGAPRSPGLHCSIGGFLVHMSGRLKFKSNKSCHGTAARPVTAHLQQGRTAPERRCSLIFFLTALRPRNPSSVTGHGPLPPLQTGYDGTLETPANFQRLPRWLICLGASHLGKPQLHAQPQAPSSLLDLHVACSTAPCLFKSFVY